MTSGEARGQAKQEESDGCHSPVWGAPLPSRHFYSQSQVVIVLTVARWLRFQLHNLKEVDIKCQPIREFEEFSKLKCFSP